MPSRVVPAGVKVSDYVADFLHARGVRSVFEMIGGMITHLIDSLHRRNAIRIVSMHHEQAAAFAADAAGRVTGVPGVAMATSGPGATNLLTGIGSCYFDSSPAVFLTGQVNRHELKGDRRIRQLGFQETDIVSVAKPLTKAAWQARSPEEVPLLLRKAFDLAADGRPGPVLVDLPMDIQRAVIPAKTVPRPRPIKLKQPQRKQVESALKALRGSKRPLIIAGGGVRAARATDAFRKFVETIRVPVALSLLGLDALPYTHPQRLGFLGSYGNRWTNLAIGRADLLLVLGSRLDIRQTGADTDAFKANRTIIHVDCDPGEMNNRIKGCETIESHLAPFLELSTAAAAREKGPGWKAWERDLATLRRKWPDTEEQRHVKGINPNLLMHNLSRASRTAGTIVSDVGQHQMWAAQSLELMDHQRFMTSGGMGSMGFGLPAAIGAAISEPGSPVVLIAGDGGFQSNLQELQTVVRNRLPLKILILNNQSHGMVRQFQESYFEGRFASTMWGYSAPDFARVADAYGVPGRTVKDADDVDPALSWMWKDPAAPALLQVMIDPRANAYPKIAFGRPMTEMEPLAKPIEMEGA